MQNLLQQIHFIKKLLQIVLQKDVKAHFFRMSLLWRPCALNL